MRRHLTTAVLSAAAGAVLLLGAACGGDSDPESEPSADAGLPAEVQAACDEYNRVINDWSRDYGAELGEVGAAGEDGDEERQEQAVDTVRELFQSAASDLRAQADAASDGELASGLTEAADGLEEIAGQIETYEDVEAAPELMADGQFAEGGQQVNEICAG